MAEPVRRHRVGESGSRLPAFLNASSRRRRPGRRLGAALIDRGAREQGIRSRPGRDRAGSRRVAAAAAADANLLPYRPAAERRASATGVRDRTQGRVVETDQRAVRSLALESITVGQPFTDERTEDTGSSIALPRRCGRPRALAALAWRRLTERIARSARRTAAARCLKDRPSWSATMFSARSRSVDCRRFLLRHGS